VGIQDFDPRVQLVINRIQTFEQTKRVFDDAREIGYTSINADIIYGLPLQTRESVADTIGRMQELMPERIAFYSYAHVPWKSKAQRRYTEADLPAREEKRALYELGRALLADSGYYEIGMDHFALPSDSLFQASEDGSLHRNFMGYTTRATGLLVGLGASSISDSWTAFAQNLKEIEVYEAAVNAGNFPVTKGHFLSTADLAIRHHILNLMCRFRTDLKEGYLPEFFLEESIGRLGPLEEDGLVIINGTSIVIPEAGRPFLRNICACLDGYLHKAQSQKPLFSKSI